jgi:hypothetical protein
MAFTTTDDTQLTPQQERDLELTGVHGYIPSLAGNATAHPTAGVPAVGGAAPAPPPDRIPAIGNAPALPVAGIPSLVKPTTQQSIAIGAAQHQVSPDTEAMAQFGKGKAAYEAERPQITAQPGSPEYEQQRIAQMEFDKSHPLGGDVSAKPGFWGKLEHGISRAANIAGDVLAPGLTANIPGSDLNKRAEESQAWKRLGEAEKNQQAETLNKEAELGNELIPWTNPQTGQTEQIERRQWAPIQAAETKATSAENIAGTKAEASKENVAAKDETAQTIAAGKDKTQLLRLGFDEHGAPLPDSQLSTQQRATRDLTQAHTKLQLAQAAADAAKADPNSPASKAAAANLALRQAEFQNKLEEQGLVKPSGQAQSRASAASAALQLLPGLEDAVKANAKEFGPIIGRINKGEISLGSVSPAVQKFYSQLQSFYALQPSVHGFRNAEFVKDFDTFVGNLQTNPEALVGGLEGLRPTLEAVDKEGRTYHQRIVEGAQNAPAAATGAAVPSFSDFVKGQH